MPFTRSILYSQSNELVIFTEDQILDVPIIDNLFHSFLALNINVYWGYAIGTLCSLDTELLLEFIGVLFDCVKVDLAVVHVVLFVIPYLVC